jgi:hypothetical protein
MKFVYFNDTGKAVDIHPDTKVHGTKCQMKTILPSEERTFYLPENTYPWVKMHSYEEDERLCILVSPERDVL